MGKVYHWANEVLLHLILSYRIHFPASIWYSDLHPSSRSPFSVITTMIVHGSTMIVHGSELSTLSSFVTLLFTPKKLLERLIQHYCIYDLDRNAVNISGEEDVRGIETVACIEE